MKTLVKTFLALALATMFYAGFPGLGLAACEDPQITSYPEPHADGVHVIIKWLAQDTCREVFVDWGIAPCPWFAGIKTQPLGTHDGVTICKLKVEKPLTDNVPRAYLADYWDSLASRAVSDVASGAQITTVELTLKPDISPAQAALQRAQAAAPPSPVAVAPTQTLVAAGCPTSPADAAAKLGGIAANWTDLGAPVWVGFQKWKFNSDSPVDLRWNGYGDYDYWTTLQPIRGPIPRATKDATFNCR